MDCFLPWKLRFRLFDCITVFEKVWKYRCGHFLVAIRNGTVLFLVVDCGIRSWARRKYRETDYIILSQTADTDYAGYDNMSF